MDIGQQLGPYLLERLIGQGGMGEVYRARDTRTNELVAVKYLVDPAHLERLREEARVLEELSSCGGTPRFLAADLTGSQAYIAMELLRGRTLEDFLLLKHREVSIQRALEIACQVAETISYANRRGILHRDIKPANIFIEEDGSARVIDFGIAKSETRSAVFTGSGVFLGTPAYASWHQQTGTTDGQDEAWSITSVFYEMATGKRAHPGKRPEDVRAILHILPERRGLDDTAWAIVQRGLNPDRSKQYRSVHELHTDLLRALGQSARLKLVPPLAPSPIHTPVTAPATAHTTKHRKIKVKQRRPQQPAWKFLVPFGLATLLVFVYCLAVFR